jgi:hypothetical protein
VRSVTLAIPFTDPSDDVSGTQSMPSGRKLLKHWKSSGLVDISIQNEEFVDDDWKFCCL